MISIGAVFFFVILFFVARFYLSLRNYPPGPLPLPLLGNVPQLAVDKRQGKSLPDSLYRWKKRYGNVITLWLGPIPTICVLDYDLAMKTYVKNGDLFVLRQQVPIIEEMREGFGIIFSEGRLWLEQRRFALHTLRDFGLGRNAMQEKILMEYHKRIDILDAEIEKNGGRLRIDPKTKLLELLIGSIINRMLVGYSFDETNMDEFIEIRRGLEKTNDSFSLLDFAILAPGLKSMPFVKWRYEQIMKSHRQAMGFAFRQIENRRNDIKNGKYHLDESTEVKDFIDAFFLEMKRREESGEDLDTFTEKQLAYTIIDLWSAGMDTTITTLNWAFLYLLKNPEVQEKMQKELLEVCGKERDVELSDRQLLPYCNAAITEVHRATSLLSLNLVRRNTEDTTIEGYSIPKGTDSAVMMSTIFRDESVFKNPELFNPDRYLAEGGKEIEQKVIAFGVGKRSCLGEGLAKAEMYLILLNIVKSYRIVDCGGVDEDWLQGTKNNFFRVAKSYECVFEKVH
ncbi:hypothetical protein QR680_019133 [Steinernema hermaphroditum]|uniref:Cytochrome P450 n=1 Tax=Steinernema hermaphroditum TaxID=289476 RepID=A0AA39LS37_9BILA|nr:hypothetical protein QR680_019133 [Steinernema hermaphroditum]